MQGFFFRLLGLLLLLMSLGLASCQAFLAV